MTAPCRGGWYVYAVARPAADLPDRLPAGVDDLPVHPVESAGLLALASALPDEPWPPIVPASADAADQVGAAVGASSPAADRWLAEAVRAHERVVEAALPGGVLPFRFGTVYPRRADVGRLLADHRSAIDAELDRLAGTAEWGVRVLGDPETLAERVLAERVLADGPLADLAGKARAASPGSAWLLRKQLQDLAGRETAARLADLLTGVHDRLLAVAMDCVRVALPRGSRPGRQTLSNASYLVGDAGAFHRELVDATGPLTELDLRTEVTGPWPAYHFVRLPLGPTATDRLAAGSRR